MSKSLSNCDQERVPDAVAPVVGNTSGFAVREGPRRVENLQRPRG